MTTDKSQIMKEIMYFLSTDDLFQAEKLVEMLRPGELAGLIETLPLAQREVFWNSVVAHESKGAILTQISEEVLSGIIAITDPEVLRQVLDSISIEGLADIFHVLPKAMQKDVLESKEDSQQSVLKRALHYGPDEAGSLLCTDVVRAEEHESIGSILERLRQYDKLPERTISIYVLNEKQQYLGHIPLHKLLLYNLDSLAGDHLETDVDAIVDTTPIIEVTRLFTELDLVALPVNDHARRFLGRIPLDEVLDAVRQESSKERQGATGVSGQEDLFGPVLKTTRSRAVWLGVNLITTFIVAWSLDLFKETLEHTIALAVLFPIVASMGGIAGNQTITLVIRGLATNHINVANLRSLMFKEIMVGVFNGIAWATLVAVAVFFWFEDVKIAFIIGMAMFINLLFAGFSGVFTPIFLRFLRVDPALAGNVILTTITDVIGIIVFLGLATILLK